MKQTYPIIMTKEKDGILVFIPDFNANTQGKDYVESMEMARDAIGLLGIDMEDDEKTLPEPSDFKKIRIKENQILSLVDVDFSEYRRKNENKVIKKNCTIPSWLNYEAEKANLNFSAVLQKALKETLNLNDRL